MDEGQKENYLWMKDRRRITSGGRIEGELLMEEGQKGELLMVEGQKENSYGGRIEGELLVEDNAQLFCVLQLDS